MVSRRSTQSVTQRSTRQSELHMTRRPRRLLTPKTLDDTVGLSRKEERELKKALYASLQESRRPRTPLLDDDSTSSYKKEVPQLRKSTRNIPARASFPSPESKKRNANANLDDSSQDSVMSSVSSSLESKKKIHAQRKFAQGCSGPSTPDTTPNKKSPISPHSLLERVPKTEDFLTFLCLRGSHLLPTNLDFFHFARDESALEESGSDLRTPVHGECDDKNNLARECTPDSNSSSGCSNMNDELREITSPITTPLKLVQDSRKAARASAGTPETARGIVSLRHGLTRKVVCPGRASSVQHSRKYLFTSDSLSLSTPRLAFGDFMPAKKSASINCLSASFLRSSPAGRLALERNGNFSAHSSPGLTQCRPPSTSSSLPGKVKDSGGGLDHKQLTKSIMIPASRLACHNVNQHCSTDISVPSECPKLCQLSAQTYPSLLNNLTNIFSLLSLEDRPMCKTVSAGFTKSNLKVKELSSKDSCKNVATDSYTSVSESLKEMEGNSNCMSGQKLTSRTDTNCGQDILSIPNLSESELATAHPDRLAFSSNQVNKDKINESEEMFSAFIRKLSDAYKNLRMADYRGHSSPSNIKNMSKTGGQIAIESNRCNSTAELLSRDIQKQKCLHQGSLDASDSVQNDGHQMLRSSLNYSIIKCQKKMCCVKSYSSQSEQQSSIGDNNLEMTGKKRLHVGTRLSTIKSESEQKQNRKVFTSKQILSIPRCKRPKRPAKCRMCFNEVDHKCHCLLQLPLQKRLERTNNPRKTGSGKNAFTILRKKQIPKANSKSKACQSQIKEALGVSCVTTAELRENTDAEQASVDVLATTCLNSLRSATCLNSLRSAPFDSSPVVFLSETGRMICDYLLITGGTVSVSFTEACISKYNSEIDDKKENIMSSTNLDMVKFYSHTATTKSCNDFKSDVSKSNKLHETPAAMLSGSERCVQPCVLSIVSSCVDAVGDGNPGELSCQVNLISEESTDVSDSDSDSSSFIANDTADYVRTESVEKSEEFIMKHTNKYCAQSPYVLDLNVDSVDEDICLSDIKSNTVSKRDCSPTLISDHSAHSSEESPLCVHKLRKKECRSYIQRDSDIIDRSKLFNHTYSSTSVKRGPGVETLLLTPLISLCDIEKLVCDSALAEGDHVSASEVCACARCDMSQHYGYTRKGQWDEESAVFQREIPSPECSFDSDCSGVPQHHQKTAAPVKQNLSSRYVKKEPFKHLDVYGPIKDWPEDKLISHHTSQAADDTYSIHNAKTLSESKQYYGKSFPSPWTGSSWRTATGTCGIEIKEKLWQPNQHIGQNFRPSSHYIYGAGDSSTYMGHQPVALVCMCGHCLLCRRETSQPINRTAKSWSQHYKEFTTACSDGQLVNAGNQHNVLPCKAPNEFNVDFGGTNNLLSSISCNKDHLINMIDSAVSCAATNATAAFSGSFISSPTAVGTAQSCYDGNIVTNRAIVKPCLYPLPPSLCSVPTLMRLTTGAFKPLEPVVTRGRTETRSSSMSPVRKILEGASKKLQKSQNPAIRINSSLPQKMEKLPNRSREDRAKKREKLLAELSQKERIRKKLSSARKLIKRAPVRVPLRPRRRSSLRLKTLAKILGRKRPNYSLVVSGYADMEEYEEEQKKRAAKTALAKAKAEARAKASSSLATRSSKSSKPTEPEKMRTRSSSTISKDADEKRSEDSGDRDVSQRDRRRLSDKETTVDQEKDCSIDKAERTAKRSLSSSGSSDSKRKDPPVKAAALDCKRPKREGAGGGEADRRSSASSFSLPDSKESTAYKSTHIPGSAVAQEKKVTPKKPAEKSGVLSSTGANQVSRDIERVPVFHPTDEEFFDPITYIENIRDKAEPFGMCLIVPPASWKMESKVNEEIRFTTQVQHLHRLFKRWGPSVEQTKAIVHHLEDVIDNSCTSQIGGVEVDLPQLYRMIRDLGGLQNIVDKKQWVRVAEAMKIPKTAHDRVTRLYDVYCKFVLPYAMLCGAERELAQKDVFMQYESSSTEDDAIFKGKSMTLGTFSRIARNVQSMWFRDDPSPEMVEAAYWKIVEGRKSHVSVQCAHVNTRTQSTAFPTRRESPYYRVRGSEYYLPPVRYGTPEGSGTLDHGSLGPSTLLVTKHSARHSWNLNNVPDNKQCILKCLGPVSGTTIPTLHVGMLFSTSCWSTDPHRLPYIHYLHSGANTVWYCIPKSSVTKFHEAMKELCPTLIHKCPLWLSEDTAMVKPEALKARGVDVVRCVQEPRQFAVVFPDVYTATVCCGYSVSESVHYATTEWLSVSMQAAKALRNSEEKELFSVDTLICGLCQDSTDVDTLGATLPMLQDIVTRELDERHQLSAAGLKCERRLAVEDSPGISASVARKRSHDLAEDSACDLCYKICYLSMVVNEHDEQILCLEHGLKHVQRKRHVKAAKLFYRYTEEELTELVQSTKERLASLQATKSSSSAAPCKKKLLKKQDSKP